MKKADKIDALKKLKAFVKSEEFGLITDGLCIANGELYADDLITEDQYFFIKKTIPKHTPYSYVWKVGAKKPRIKWINEQKKKLEKK